MKNKRVTEELSDKECIGIKDNGGEQLHVCVGTRRDMGKRGATVISKRKTETYDDLGRFGRDLQKMNIPREERVKAIRFVSKGFRDSILEKREISGGLGINGFGIKGKKSKETKTE